VGGDSAGHVADGVTAITASLEESELNRKDGNRWKDYDSECDSEDYNCGDADAALRKDMVLCRELRVTNHRGIQSYSGVDGTLREKLNDTIFG
jgi:hypothetical protein